MFWPINMRIIILAGVVKMRAAQSEYRVADDSDDAEYVVERLSSELMSTSVTETEITTIKSKPTFDELIKQQQPGDTLSVSSSLEPLSLRERYFGLIYQLDI